MVREIYRFEHYKTGEGPWISGALRKAIADLDEYVVPSTGPGPCDEQGELREIYRRGNTPDYHFGFRSIEQLKAWPYFNNTKLLKAMHKHGLRLCVYKVPPEDTADGIAQVAFKMENARWVKTIPIMELVEQVSVQV